MITGASIFTFGYLICILVARSHHIGFPMSTLTLDDMTSFLQITFAIEITYYTILFSIKTSIIAMYLRFAVSKTFRHLCNGTIILHTLFFLVCLACTIWQCRPVEKAWDVLGQMSGTCINTTAFFYFTSGFNIVTDLWILLLPIPTLRYLRIRQREKVALYGVFGIGIFATALSVVRLQSIYTFTLSKDPFHDGILVNLWSMIEVNSAIICASIPAMKPLFTPQQFLAGIRSSKNKSGYEYHDNERSGPCASGSTASRIISVNDRPVRLSEPYDMERF